MSIIYGWENTERFSTKKIKFKDVQSAIDQTLSELGNGYHVLNVEKVESMGTSVRIIMLVFHKNGNFVRKIESKVKFLLNNDYKVLSIDLL
jgi:hypothetical protein